MLVQLPTQTAHSVYATLLLLGHLFKGTGAAGL